MKTRGFLLLLSVMLCSSCIVKSIQPFYITSSLSKHDKLIGSWIDNKEGIWSIQSFEEKLKEEKKQNSNLSEFDYQFFETHKKGYLASYSRKNHEVEFILMPFKINDQFFVDMIPILFDSDAINPLALAHLQAMHTVAKLDTHDGNLSFSWLSESKIDDLIKDNKLRIKHEKMGIEASLLLTANSEELYNFLKKYMSSDIDDKWKKRDQLTLTKTKNAKP